MAGTNDFKALAIAGSANVVSQAAYEGLTALLDDGFTSGIAESNQINKVFRQATFGVAAIAQAMAEILDENIEDNGAITDFKNQFIRLLQQAGVSISHAGGTANALTGVYSPEITELRDGMLLALRAAATNTGSATFTPNSGIIAAKAIRQYNNKVLTSGSIAGVGHWLLLQYDSTTDHWMLLNPASGSGSTSPGAVNVIDATATNFTVSTVIPYDNTIPDISEGDEILSVTYTPSAAGANYIIEAMVNLTPHTAGYTATAALFDVDTPVCLDASFCSAGASGGTYDLQTQIHLGGHLGVRVAADTTPLTFSVRVGVENAAASVEVNGTAASALRFGGVMKSYIRVREV